MKRSVIVVQLTIFLVAAMILSACNLPASGGPSDIALQQTSVAQTVAVMQTQLAVNATPEMPVIATNTPEAPASLPTVTNTVQINTLAPTFTPQPSYKISNVVDVTYPDNTVVKPNTTFTKTWRLTNAGTGTWTSNFKLVFVSGDAMGGPASKPIGKSVPPGSSVDISIDLTAPATNKTYQGKWMLQTESGANFGIGANADGTFWVKIIVEQTFAVTKAVVSIAPAAHNGPCPVNLAITAAVTTTAPGKVTYYFITTFGNSPKFELVFDAAGTKNTPAYALPVAVTGPVTVSFYNDNPNHQEFVGVTVPVTCVP